MPEIHLSAKSKLFHLHIAWRNASCFRRQGKGVKNSQDETKTKTETKLNLRPAATTICTTNMYRKRVNVAQTVALPMPIVVPLASGKHLLPTLQRRHCHCLNLWVPFCFVWCKHFASQVHLFLNALQGPRRASLQSASAATSTLWPFSICVGVPDFLLLAGLPQFDAIDFRPHPHPPVADRSLHSAKNPVSLRPQMSTDLL